MSNFLTNIIRNLGVMGRESINGFPVDEFEGRVREIQEVKDIPVDDAEEIAGSELMVFVGDGKYSQMLVQTLGVNQANIRKELEAASKDPFISGALELYTDDAVQLSRAQGRSIWPKQSRSKEVLQFLDDNDVENKIWGWGRDLALYGDLVFKTMGADKEGLQFIDDVVPPYTVMRVELNSRLVGFYPLGKNQDTSTIQRAELDAPFDHVHFLLNSRNDKKAFVPIKDEDKREVVGKLTTRRGTSLIADALPALKALRLIEQSISLARASRSGYVRIFHVNTTGLVPKQRRNLVRAIERRLKKDQFIDVQGNKIQSEYAPVGFSDDIVMPYTDKAGEVRVEGVGGDVQIRDVADLEYMRDKLFAALRIPKAYLGFEETLPGAMGSTTLLRLDIRYARSVKKLQRAILQGMQRIVQVHLAYKLQRIPAMKEYQLQMEIISGAEEADRQEAMSVAVRNASELITAFGDMKAIEGLEKDVDMNYVVDYVTKNIIGDLDVKKLMVKRKEEPPEGGDEEEPEEEEGEEGEEEDKTQDDDFLMSAVRDVALDLGDLKAHLPVKDHLKELKELLPDNKRYNLEEEKQEDSEHTMSREEREDGKANGGHED